MACSSCQPRKTLFQVRFKDGTVRRFANETDAKAVADKTDGAEYQKVQR